MTRKYLLSVFAILFVATAVSFTVSHASVGRLRAIPAMHARRADHTATLLPDGRVLIAGGMVENGVFLDSAELFDPSNQTFLPAANMLSRRVGHTATLLPNGKVLIAGGSAGRLSEGGPGIVATTEIFDPTTGRFTAGPMMTSPRNGHAAVLLPNNKVLIIGGTDQDERPLKTAEIYDPATNRFTTTASMNVARLPRPAVLLQDGRVLVTGGWQGSGIASRAAEVFDPKTSSWTAVGDMTEPREKHAAILLADGRVLIIGGAHENTWRPVDSMEVFDPATNRFTAIGNMEAKRFKLPDGAVALKDGTTLIAGGAAEMELYDAATRTTSRVASLPDPIYFASATRLHDGRVLIAGGYGSGINRANGPLSSDRAWIYQPQ